MFNQNQRMLKLQAPLEGESLILTHFRGIESISAPFEFELLAFSTDTTISPDDLLGKAVTVIVGHEQMPSRVFNGIVMGFQPGTIDYDGKRQYRLVITPWLQSLAFNSDCRIFQNQTVPEIFTTICKGLGFADYNIDNLQNTYEPLEYCVQYNESSLDFINRIFAEAGIFYYFLHTETQHIMMLADQGTVLPQLDNPIPYANIGYNHPHISQWQTACHFHASAIAHSDYNFIHPDKSLLTDTNSLDGTPTADGVSQFAHFHYPGKYRQLPKGTDINSRAMTAIEWQSQLIHGEGNDTAIQAGNIFTLSQHDDPNQIGDYLPLQVYHDAQDTTHVPGGDQIELAQKYSNRFVCLSQAQVFVPSLHFAPAAADLLMAQIAPKQPVIHGNIPAIVVGPKGKEIYTDQYGRVKVQFKWDRYGQLDENSSCWLRSIEMSSGNSWGSQFIPRIGDEVRVSFLHGDPDRPVITACAYNDDNKEPYAQPDNANLSSINTHILGSKIPTQGHRIVCDDTPGATALTLHSENAVNQDILNDYTHTAAGGEVTSINGRTILHVASGHGKVIAKTAVFSAGGSTFHLAGGVHAKPGGAGVVNLQAAGVAAVKPVARVSDFHNCPKHSAGVPHKGGPVLTGSGLFKANGMPVARIGDKAHCRVGTDSIAKGVVPIKVNGVPIARQGDKCNHGGAILAGSPNVLVGPITPHNITLPSVVSVTPQTKPFTCDLKDLVVQCGHEKRTFKLHATPKPAKNESGTEKVVEGVVETFEEWTANTIQVIASDKTPDKMKITYTGRCRNPNPPDDGKLCPSVKVVGPNIDEIKQGNFILDVYSKKTASPEHNFIEFFQQILLPNSTNNASLYTLTPMSCAVLDLPELVIEAVAPVQWQGQVSLGFQHQPQHSSEAQQHQDWEDQKTQGTWGLSGSISVKRNSETWSLGASTEQAGGTLHQQIFQNMQKFLNHLLPFFSSLKSNYVSANIIWPQLTLGGQMQNVEYKDKYGVTVEGEVYIECTPLIGVGINLDIINWITAILGGPFGEFIVNVKERLAEEVGGRYVNAQAELSLILSINSTIEGGAKWQKTAEGKWKTLGKNGKNKSWSSAAKLEGDLDISLTGKVEGQFKFFMIKVAGGIIASGKSGVSVALIAKIANDKPSVCPQFGFNGLVVYWAVFYQVSISKVGRRRSFAPPSEDKKTSIDYEKKLDHSYTIIEPKYWPELDGDSQLPLDSEDST